MSSLLCSFLLTENRKCRRWLNRCDTPKQIESSTGRVCVYKMKGSFNNAPCNHTDTDKLIITIKAPGTGSIKYHCECVCVSRRMRCISSSGIRLAVPKWNPRILMYYITEHAGLRDGTGHFSPEYRDQVTVLLERRSDVCNLLCDIEHYI